MFYLQETDKCLSGAAFFASNVMGAAALEAVLLLACLKYQSKVLATRRWQQLYKRARPERFSHMLAKSKIGLAALLQISLELHWFPSSGFPSLLRAELVKVVGEPTVAGMERGISGVIDEQGLPSVISIPEFVLALSSGVRNALHPVRCIKQPLGDLRFISAWIQW